MKNFLKISLSISLGCILALVLGELILRVYNPIPTRIKGDKIKLLTNYKRSIKINKEFFLAGIDETINYSTNSLGYRGSELPENVNEFFTIFTVGGSTTECSLLDDTKTWSYLLEKKLTQNENKFWLNNAGIDGCSTFGHQVLLENHLYDLKPNMIIFLVGINEMWAAKSKNGDEFLVSSKEYILRGLSQKSELVSFLWNFYRLQFARTHDVGHSTSKNLAEISEEEWEVKSAFFKNDQPNYHQRIDKIVKDCLAQNIVPVLVTQPVYQISKLHPYSFVELYNTTTREVAKANNVLLVDLAVKLENIDNYYYDAVHYTNYGAEQVATIIYNELIIADALNYNEP